MPRPLLRWLALGAAGLLSFAAVSWSERLPPVIDAGAAASSFSAERARPVLEMLADTIGRRVAGTMAADRAAAYLLAQLQAIDGLEVILQDTIASRPTSYGATLYRTRNVLARRRGRLETAVMLSSHYDGQEEGPAAADAAAATAVMVEMARALAGDAPPRHTIILNINGAEERGLLGAHGALLHPWLDSVRVFLDLESSGNRGKAILFQVGPGNAWLARRYAAAAPHPYGTVIGQDIFASGAVPSQTDFEVYARAGLAGLDFALFRNGYAYHTELDVAASLASGSLQHMGANALAVTRALADGEFPTTGRNAVYYDLLGTAMLAYSESTARMLAAVAILIVIGSVVFAVRRVRPGRWAVALAAATTLIATVAGIVVPVGASIVIAVLAGRPHRWFATPAPAVVGYLAFASAAALGVHALAERLTPRLARRESSMVAAWSGSLLLMAAALMLFSLSGVASAYLLLWWVVPGAIGLIVLAAGGRRAWFIALAVGILPGLLMTWQFTTLVLSLFLPIAGRMILAVPFDIVVAGLVAVPTVIGWALAAPVFHEGGRPGRAALGLAVLALLSLAISATRPPYSPERPQRLTITHELGETRAGLYVTAGDYPGPGSALRTLTQARPLDSVPGTWLIPDSSRIDAAPSPVVERVDTTETGDRLVALRLPRTEAHEAYLSVGGGVLAGWFVFEDAPLPRPRGLPTLRLVAAPDTGWRIMLRLTGAGPRSLALTTVQVGRTPAIARLLRQLPPWTTSNTLVHRVYHLPIP